jgi:hypothetical protein
MLKEKVFVDLEADKETEKSGKKRDKIFCLAYTIHQQCALKDSFH